MAETDPLADMAFSRAHKAAVRKQLAQLAAQDHQPALRQLARDVLAGKVDLRGAILGPRYTDLLDEATGQFSGWYRNLSAEARADQERQGEAFAVEAHAELVAEQRQARRPRPPDDDEWETPGPILKKRIPRR